MSEPSRTDKRLYIRALSQGWNIPRKLRKEIVETLHKIITAEGNTSRERTSAARAIMQASRVELDAIRLAHGAQYENLVKRMENLEEKTDGGLAEAAGAD
jgi:hypothetical protein